MQLRAQKENREETENVLLLFAHRVRVSYGLFLLDSHVFFSGRVVVYLFTASVIWRVCACKI